MRKLLFFLFAVCLSLASALQPQISEAAQRNSTAAAQDPAKIQSDLDTYAVWYIETMNRELKPGEKSKEVAKHPDGYMARYMMIDPASLKTSYTVSQNKAVAYIGRVMFHRVEYVCIAKSREQALAGPFVESNRQPVTELIMHLKGKWTYRY